MNTFTKNTIAAVIIGLSTTSLAYAGLPINGPDLDGTNVGAVAPKTFAAMSMNGPDLDGTRVIMRIEKPGNQIENPIVKFTDLMISSYR